MHNGLIFSLVVLLPNLFMVLLPPRNIPPEITGQQSKYIKIIGFLERAGQVGCFSIPFFYSIHTETLANRIVLGFAGAALLFYYTGWLRYVFLGRQYRILYSPLAKIPLPMAISPIIVFFLASLNLNALPLSIAALVLAVGHIPVSWYEWKRSQLAII
jgi:hypothetical protein